MTAKDSLCPDSCSYVKEDSSEIWCFKPGGPDYIEECRTSTHSLNPSEPGSTGQSYPGITSPSEPGNASPSDPGSAFPSGTVSTSVKSTLSPTDIIKAANDRIVQASEEYEVAVNSLKTANDASAIVDKIQAKLSPSSSTLVGRNKRQAESSTVGAVSSCNDFSIKYLLLLDELIALSDNNVGLIKQLVAVINAAIDIPCDDNEKKTLKDEADLKVNNAKANAEEYKKEKEESIEELVRIVRAAQTEIEEANGALSASLLSTVAALTPIFTFPTEEATSRSTSPHQSSTQQGSSTPVTSPSEPGNRDYFPSKC